MELRESAARGPAGTWLVENLLRPVLVAVMLACLATPLLLVLESLVGGWSSTPFVIFLFLAGLEGVLSERVLGRRRITGYAYLASRVAEALVLLLLLKLSSYAWLGPGQLQADLQLLADVELWLAEPGRLISVQDQLAAALFLPLWIGALAVGRLLCQLDVEEGKRKPPADKTSPEYYLWLTEPSAAGDRQAILERLAEMFLWGGVVILGAATAAHLLPLGAGQLALPTMLYFAVGVALLSQGRFSVLFSLWERQGVPVQRGIARRWLVWALIFLVSVALVALLLPTSYAMGPVRALMRLLSLLYWVLSFVLGLFLALLTFLIRLLFPNVEMTRLPSGPPAPLSAPEQAAGAQAMPWLEILGTALFWVVILSIAGYAALRFLRDRIGSLDAVEGGEGRWWQRLLLWLRDVWRAWRRWGQGVQERLVQRQKGAVAGPPRAGARRGFFSLRRLSPRELVRYFYLSTERRAAQAGQPRQAGQTPYEYRASLGERYGELEPDLTGLTEAFVQARYSPQPVEPRTAEAARPLWQRLRAALRRRRAGQI